MASTASTKRSQPPERLTYTFEFEPMAGHISTETITFDELSGRQDANYELDDLFTTLEDLEGDAPVRHGGRGGRDLGPPGRAAGEGLKYENSTFDK